MSNAILRSKALWREPTEEYTAGKGTGEMPTKLNKRGRDREST